MSVWLLAWYCKIGGWRVQYASYRRLNNNFNYTWATIERKTKHKHGIHVAKMRYNLTVKSYRNKPFFSLFCAISIPILFRIEWEISNRFIVHLVRYANNTLPMNEILTQMYRTWAAHNMCFIIRQFVLFRTTTTKMHAWNLTDFTSKRKKEIQSFYKQTEDREWKK